MANRQGFEDAVLERIGQTIDPMVNAVSSRLGPAPDTKKYTASDQLAEWNYSPIASPQQRVEAMLTMKMQGKSDEEITDFVYPNRRRLITTGRTRADEQIAYAREMARLMERKAQEMGHPPAMDAMPGSVPQAQPLPGQGATMPAPQTAPTQAPAPVPQQPSMLDAPAMSMIGG